MPRKKIDPAPEPEQNAISELPETEVPMDGEQTAAAPPQEGPTPGDTPGGDIQESTAVPEEAPSPDPADAPPPDDLPPGEDGDAGDAEAAEDAGDAGDREVVDIDLTAPVDPPEATPEAAPEVEPPADNPVYEEERPAPAQPPQSDRQQFYGLDFNALDRDLTPEERQEWNSIYASYRGRSALTGTIIGVDPHSISVWNRQTEEMERQTMYCAIVVPYRVRVVIPASEMWETGLERPDFVLQNMVGAAIDFIIIKVDRESGFAIGSRRLALRAQRYFFSRRPTLNTVGAKLKCRVLSVGPRRCLVECYGHDINMTQRELRYTAIPDLREQYHPGQELDCLVKSYDPEQDKLEISVKETESNPFDGAELRHPVGSRRQATIAGKYGGGVFCNLPDGTVCMCNYSYQYEDADFMVGDTVILLIQRYDVGKKQMYGKIMTKW